LRQACHSLAYVDLNSPDGVTTGWHACNGVVVTLEVVSSPQCHPPPHFIFFRALVGLGGHDANEGYEGVNIRMMQGDWDVHGGKKY
jgi:hypothetical protein